MIGFFIFQSALMVPLELKLKASEFGLVATEEEVWGRVVGRRMAGFKMYS